MTDDEQETSLALLSGRSGGLERICSALCGAHLSDHQKTSALRGAQAPQDFVDDLFQGIFLTLIQDDFFQLRRFRGDHGCTLASWLRMIAARRTIDYLRRSRFPAEALEKPLENYLAQTREPSYDPELLQSLAKAVEDLPPHEKILIDLFFREGLSPKTLQPSSGCPSARFTRTKAVSSPSFEKNKKKPAPYKKSRGLRPFGQRRC